MHTEWYTASGYRVCWACSREGSSALRTARARPLSILAKAVPCAGWGAGMGCDQLCTEHGSGFHKFSVFFLR